MSTEDLGRALGQSHTGADLRGQAPVRAGSEAALAEALALIDRIVAEPGRRRHLLGWLKRPGGGSEDWLPVDSYYPANRLVVVSPDPAAGSEATFRELVPAHGLRLLELGLEELAGDREALLAALERRIAELGPAPRRPAAAAAGQLAPEVSAPPAPAGPPRARGEVEATGVLAGLALAVALVLEVYFGVARLGLGSGNVLLAFGLALDACSRALGTLAGVVGLLAIVVLALALLVSAV